MTCPQSIESTRLSLFVSGALCGKQIGLRRRANANPALNINANVERPMSMIPDSAWSPSAQVAPTDPLIIQARFINEAADLERRLAIRKALRPMRSDAARRGWEARNAR